MPSEGFLGNRKDRKEKVATVELSEKDLSALLDRIDSLEKKLSALSEQEKINSDFVANKKDRLDRIRHGLVEMDDRMERPYVVSPELQAVKETLDVLSESGECNSVILEGEPGTGKTQWAYSEVGQELQEGNDVSLIHVRVKDTMSAQDLLYSIDDVRRLSDAQASAQVSDDMRSKAGDWKRRILSGEVDPVTDEAYQEFRSRMEAVTELEEAAKDLDYLNYVDLGPLGEAIYQSGKGKKVYLVIDEIEKGREELMTGMLDEIENLVFTIPETGTVVEGDKKNLRIIITTNTEDSDKIPPSFRRRSLYHFIEYPSREDMAQIVTLNFPHIQQDLLDYAIQVFYQYHESEEIEKKPSTPELLAWIRVLSKDFDNSVPEGVPHKEILLKYSEDHSVMIPVDWERDYDEYCLVWMQQGFGINLSEDSSPQEIHEIINRNDFPVSWLLGDHNTNIYRQAPPSVLAALAQRSDWEIRKAVAEHPNTEYEIIDRLTNDSDPDVSDAAHRSLEDRNL